MKSKYKIFYVCENCGYESPKWLGKCPECQSWNTFVEDLRGDSKQVKSTLKSKNKPYKLAEIETDKSIRYKTSIEEFDRVLGGGLVKGSLILLSGDPGIGKSTLILQICEELGNSLKILYVSGEESIYQIKLRAKRLGIDNENLYLLSETDLESVLNQIDNIKPQILIIDSIQTMNIAEISSYSGSVTQIRESTNAIMKKIKMENIATIIVGHVNKDGNIAGPKILEHIVDSVLYFEGEKNSSYRIIRAVKNRYGSTNEIGVFDMGDSGLKEIKNPSITLMEGRPKGMPGNTIACVLEGTRPIMAELQALVTKTTFGNPRRMSSGFDYNRLNMILAVLEKSGGYFFSNMDVYVNVVGGFKLRETSCDLSLALSLISSLKEKPLKDDTICFGEIGLSGEIRNSFAIETRVKEAVRLGFNKCIVPKVALKDINKSLHEQIEVVGVNNLIEAFHEAVQ
ncbi:MAG: DNA repair protein RadA [Clostridia bacterium]|nr:DNA repair protein RadA [Clostridia bacterium]